MLPPPKKPTPRSSKVGRRLLRPLLIVAFALLLAVPIANDPPVLALIRAKKAQEFTDQLRVELSIENYVGVVVVGYHPLVFSVEPANKTKSDYLLSMELGFLLMLDDEELRAALAHELGHVWVFTHRPYLQTERLANEIGLRVVHREALESVYTKLWAYEGTAGVPFDQLLGPRADE
jgi:hypothetical protein